jgi:uncharacterized protein YndB with AHSA1/START domain
VPSYDVTDEAIIEAPPARVFRALLDEYAGVTHWWTQVESTPIGDVPFDQVGAKCRVTVRNHGAAHFTWKTIEVVENRLMRFEYVDGDIVGHGDLTLDPAGDGTRIAYRWRVRTRGLASIAGPLLGISRRHSEVIQAGFRALEEFTA